MPTFVVLEIDCDPDPVMRAILPREGVKELCRGVSLAELMNAIEDAEFAACRARREKVMAESNAARERLVRLMNPDLRDTIGLYDAKPIAEGAPTGPPVDDSDDDSDDDDDTPFIVGAPDNR